MPRERIKAIIPNSEFSGSRDLYKIIEIRVFVGDLGHKPRVRLFGVPKSEIMIAGVQVGTGLSPQAYHVVHV